ncbi:MAG: AMP-binding protein [Rhodospirillales bacterium]|nr:AMP-binding protein [Rhodospirillales bacterium]
MLTTQALLERSLAAFADRVAVIDQGRTITYAALDARSRKLANALMGLGAGVDRPVAIFLGNDFHFVEIDAACMRAGITRVGISSRLAADECQFIVNHSGAAVLITSSALLATLDPAALDSRPALVLVDGKEGAGHHDYESLLAKGADRLSAPRLGPDHSAYVLYTSGTTGRPKGASHTQGSRVAALVNMLGNEIVADKNSAMVHCAPLTHGSGSKILSFLALGARNIILPRFEPELFARAIVEQGGSHSFMVPTMLHMLIEAGPKVCEAVRRMRQLSFGGAPITNAAFGRALEAFGPRLVQVYGTSEAPHPATVLKPDDYMDAADPSALAETAGRASLSTELAVIDDEGQRLGAGQEGELLLRGNYVMGGYWQDEAATAEVFDAQGWYKTGDVAVIDDQGFVRFKDRKRDLIISGGLNVYPSEVERVLAAHPDVREVAVIGYPDDRWGESVMACVVPRDRQTASEEALIAWLEGRIAGYKKPRKVTFLDELPKGSTNKVLKRALRERFWAGRGRRIN